MDKENGEKVIFQPDPTALFLDERSYTMKKIIIVVSLVCLFVLTAGSEKQWGQVLKYQFLYFSWKKFRSKERA